MWQILAQEESIPLSFSRRDAILSYKPFVFYSSIISSCISGTVWHFTPFTQQRSCHMKQNEENWKGKQYKLPISWTSQWHVWRVSIWRLWLSESNQCFQIISPPLYSKSGKLRKKVYYQTCSLSSYVFWRILYIYEHQVSSSFLVIFLTSSSEGTF